MTPTEQIQFDIDQRNLFRNSGCKDYFLSVGIWVFSLVVIIATVMVIYEAYKD